MTTPTTPVDVLPPAVDALRDVIRTALPEVTAANPDEGVEVFDGPSASRAFAPRAVTVASAFEDDQDAVATDRVESGAKPHIIETLDVACSIYVGGGDSDEVAVRDYRRQAGEILAAIENAIRRSRGLGGVVDRVRLGSIRWLQGSDSHGSAVIVGFIVSMVSIR